LPENQKGEVKKQVNDKGWEYLMRKDGYMDPIYLPPSYPNGTELNSENFNWREAICLPTNLRAAKK